MKLIFVCIILCYLTLIVFATEREEHHTRRPATTTKRPATTTKRPETISRCPAPTSQQLGCLSEWACQHVIRLDLRCLLSLNGNPLLGGGGGIAGGGNQYPGLLGGVLGPVTNTLGLTGGGGGGGTQNPGILAGLLGG